VSRLFCREADFHLYHWVDIRTYRQYNSFYIATLHTPKRRARVSHISYALPNAYFLNNFLLTEFPNLVSLNLDTKGLFHTASILIPREGYPFRLRSLLCDLLKVDDAFLRFIGAHPTLAEIDVVCDDAREGGGLPNAIAPSLERVACPLSTVGSFVPGHPVTRFELAGTVNELDVFESLLPALRKSSAPIEHLSITVMDCSSCLFEGIAASLPGLTHLSIQVSDPPDSSFYSLHAPKEESDSTRFTETISPLTCLQDFEYGTSLSHYLPFLSKWASRIPALQSFTLFVEEIEIKILRDATGQWRVFSWCPKSPSSTRS
jgi:hypothetical protein